MMPAPFRRRLMACCLPLALGACGLTDWADANMPVIGQRCEHWQCFTESGQQESEAIHNQRMKEQAAANAPPGAMTPADNPAAAPPPAAPVVAAPAATAAAPAPYVAPDPMAPGMQPVPTYQYVPRAPAAPGTTPFDGNIPPVAAPPE